MWVSLTHNMAVVIMVSASFTEADSRAGTGSGISHTGADWGRSLTGSIVTIVIGNAVFFGVGIFFTGMESEIGTSSGLDSAEHSSKVYDDPLNHKI